MVIAYRLVRLWADRVRLVWRYLEHPALWPDGIDTKYGRWYLGREGYWRGLLRHLDGEGRWEGGVDDEVAFNRWAEEAPVLELPKPVVVDVPSIAAGGVDRKAYQRDWLRKRRAERKGGG